MNLPENLLYTKDHEWVRLEGKTAYIGITDFAQGELGDIVYVDISSLGQLLGQHDTFGTVEAVKTVSDLFMPVSGEVVEVNAKLDADPALVNSDPYGDGWMIRVAMTEEGEAAAKQLMSAADYKSLVAH